MTGTIAAPTPGFVRRNRVTIGLTLAVLLTLTVLSWLGRGDAGRGGQLDPENPKPGGARAVAQVLGDHGVPVDIARGKRALAGAGIDADTTVVVSNPGALGESTWTDLNRRVEGGGAVLVVAGLSLPVIDGLGLSESDLREGPDGPEESQCSPGQPLVDGLTLESEPNAAVAGDGCFGDAQHRQLLVDQDQRRWVLTNPFPLTNSEIDRADNAAVVLRLLGQRERVVWYVADATDTVATDAVGLSRLLPDWLIPSLWLLAVSAGALLLWRGRRLGPLVTEPVPVTIKALESTTALGRLYERARDRPHAARLLIEGSAGRLASHLGLSASLTRDELVRAVAAETGRPVEAVTTLLPEPSRIRESVRSDADLVTLAQNLHHLEEEVRTR